MRFGHALIRDTLYDGADARRAGWTCTSAPGRRSRRCTPPTFDPHLAELAHHFIAAASGSHGEGSAVDVRAPGRPSAAAQLAYEEAVRLYEMAL